MSRLRRPRRGIVMLVVLSLLVLFTMMIVTFVLVSGQYRRAAEATARQEMFGVDPQKQLESVIYTLLRDTPFQGSVLRYHSLLRDLYGADGFIGYVGGPPSLPAPTFAVGTGNQFLDIAFAPGGVVGLTGSSLTPSSTAGSYAGCVFSVLSGPARGATTRIVGYVPATPSQAYGVLRVVAMKTPGGRAVTALDLVNSSNPSAPYQFLVNGRPFNGTGVGYDPNTGAANPTYLGKIDTQYNTPPNVLPIPSALLPNYAVVDPAMDGDLDESYDAADVQNMALGLVPPNLASAADILPSFHRRELVNFWRTNVPASIQNNAGSLASFLSRVILRPLPLPTLHPNFTGSNADSRYTYNTANPQALNDLLNALTDGPWDVDNDGDGITDSVWLDLGFPVVTAPDGRKYKPLFAILCTDLDSRLNVNAHDRVASVQTTAPTPVSIGDPAAGITTQILPGRGQGYGPAEISLAGLFGTNLATLQNQRYAGNGAGAAAFDTMTAIRFFDHPLSYFTGAVAVFRSPPDLHGELRMGLSMAGQPQWEVPLLGVSNIPYQLNLSLDLPAGDTPFLAAELERVLRHRDLDAAELPGRLAQFVPDLNGDSKIDDLDRQMFSRLITTHSNDLPAPGVLNARTPRQRALHVTDLLRQRLIDGNGWTLPLTPAQEQAISVEIDKMFSPDVILGMRMDLNRVFGDDADNNNNGAVNDPAEAAMEMVWTGVTRAEYQNIALNHVNGVDVNSDGTFNDKDRMLARQLYARHLYVLAMTLCAPSNSVASPPPQAFARQVAQWAVNVVDFRDCDAIMTPFEYDPNPFNGWNVDGIVSGSFIDPTTNQPVVSADDDPTQENVVWGCERPELLIAETLAWHDRRTEDLASDDGDHDYVGTAGKGKGKGKGNGQGDDDYDQRLRPRSAFFVELFNPWSGTDTLIAPPRELYGITNGNNADRGVLLSKRTSGGYPVWRLLVMDRRYPGQPDMHQDPDRSSINAARGVYFADPTALGAAAVHGRRKYYPSAVPLAAIKPGQYAVVGSAGTQFNNEYCSFVGRNRAADETLGNLHYQYTRRVALIPNVDPNINQVKVYQGGDVTQPVPAPQLPPSPAVGIAINWSDGPAPLPLSISEPVGGYLFNPPTIWDQTAACGEGAWTPPKDTPGDLDPANNTPYVVDTMFNGTIQGFAVVHLQRLADPTRDYHAKGNPYRTIDSASVDLTSFNGLEDFDPCFEPAVGEAKAWFETRQRGDHESAPPPRPPQNRRKLWRHEPDPTTGTTPNQNSTREGNPPIHYFDFLLAHTFGSLNRNYIGPGGSAFPWLTWNDRPFVSQYELLQVPGTGSYDLLRKYDFDATATVSPYGTGTNPPVAPFGHLFNFFDSVNSGANPDPYDAYRLLEYTHVPSRFNGTETIFNPTNFMTAAGADHFRPPFNRLSNFRDPGRININTIVDARVWNAIVNGFPAPTFDELVASRRGYAATPANALFAADPNVPTLFANAFRAPGSGSLVPLANMVRKDIETTLLRSDKVAAGGNPNDHPLFQSNPATITEVYRDVRRNPYFRYQNLHRLGNLLTTRSNVYATWITMGYFEVDDQARLGQEVGVDTGEVKRHRAFYLIDRSIPVAFQPGENHNVDRCILVRRFIE